MKSVGHDAYDSWAASAGDGDAIPWDQLPEAVRRAWEEAVQGTMEVYYQASLGGPQ